MATSLDVAPVILKQLRGLQRIIVSPRALLKQVGALVANDCRRSFVDQKLGDILWPPRYPGQRSPKLNIAGALQDFIDGRAAPKPNRFEDRPANVDEGMRGGLQASITFNVVSETTVRIGTVKPYGALMQEGGTSTQVVLPNAQDRIRNWLYPTTAAGKPQTKYVKTKKFPSVVMADIYGGPAPMQNTKRSEYAIHLGHFLPENWSIGDFVKSHVGEIVHTQKVLPRPFIGVTDKAQEEIDQLIKFHMNKAQGM